MTDPTTGGTVSSVPERPAWSRPPFEVGNTLGFKPGNTLSTKHGARSARLEEFVAGRVVELTDGIYAELPHLSRADYLAVRALATAEAIVEHLLTYALDHGMVIDGRPAPVLGPLREWMSRAEKARARIGADPRSARDLAVSELTVRDLAATLRAAQIAKEAE